MVALKLASTNQSPRSQERAALADTLARRNAAKRELQSAQAAEEKAREYRYDAECKLERAKASNEALCLDEYIQAVAADDTGAQVKAVVSSADIRQLEQDYEHWELMQAACHERVRELETAERYILIEPRIDAVIRAGADVLSLLDGFESLRAELDRRLSVLTWLQSCRLVRDEDLEAVKSAIASCFVLPRDEGAIDAWRKAVKELETDADTQLPRAK